MPTANLVEYFVCRTRAAMRHVFKALPDGFMHIGAGNEIEKPLIGFRVLHDCFRFTLNGQYNWPFGLLSCFMNWAGLRRKVVTEWMSFEMSNMGLAFL
jgi:hypothetical protein